MTQELPDTKYLDWSKIRDGDTIEATGETLNWLIQQLVHWPTRIDEKSTTNMSFLMCSAARTLARLAKLEADIRKVRDGYASQMKFCDIEALGYFREFLRRIDAVLPSPPEGPDA